VGLMVDRGSPRPPHELYVDGAADLSILVRTKNVHADAAAETEVTEAEVEKTGEKDELGDLGLRHLLKFALVTRAVGHGFELIRSVLRPRDRCRGR